MPFDPLEFLDAAFQLNQNQKLGFCESAYRIAVGRAYYAAFLKARDHAGLAHVRTDSHKAVFDHFGSMPPGTKGPSVAHKLRELAARRKKSDYELDSAICLRDAKGAAAQSRNVLNLLNQI